MALPGGACTIGPSFRKPYGEHSFRAFHLLFLLTWASCWLSLPFHFVTTWLRPSDTAHVPPFRVRDVCRRWHRVPLLGPRASTLSAANLFFLPPTHNRRRGPAQGYRQPILCRLFWLWIDRRVPTNVGSLCLSLFSARVILLSSHLELVAATVTLPFFPRYSSFSC